MAAPRSRLAPTNSRRHELSRVIAKAEQESLSRTRGLSMNNLDPQFILMKGREAELAAQQATQTRKRHSTLVGTTRPNANISPTKTRVRKSVCGREAMKIAQLLPGGPQESLGPKGRKLRAAGDRPRSMTVVPPNTGGSLPKEHPMNNSRFVGQLEELRNMMRSSKPAAPGSRRSSMAPKITITTSECDGAGEQSDSEKLAAMTEQHNELLQQVKRLEAELRIEKNLRQDLQKTVEKQQQQIAALSS